MTVQRWPVYLTNLVPWHLKGCSSSLEDSSWYFPAISSLNGITSPLSYFICLLIIISWSLVNFVALVSSNLMIFKVKHIFNITYFFFITWSLPLALLLTPQHYFFYIFDYFYFFTHRIATIDSKSNFLNCFSSY